MNYISSILNGSFKDFGTSIFFRNYWCEVFTKFHEGNCFFEESVPPIITTFSYSGFSKEVLESLETVSDIGKSIALIRDNS